MGIMKRRSALVTFRVSVEEYAELQASCLKSGTRSISEFVRVATLQKVHTKNSPEAGLSGDLMTVSKGLRELDGILGEVRKRIRGVLGPAPRTSEHRSEIGVAGREES